MGAEDTRKDEAAEETSTGPLEAQRPPAAGTSQQTAAAQKRRIVAMEATAYTGPLPPPDMLEQYNRAFPGCAERIVRMAEDRLRHRQALEKSVVESKIRNERLGQWFAFILGMAGIAGAVYLVTIGKSLEGFGVFLFSLGSLVGAFLVAQRRQARELEDKRREIEAARAHGG